ncbi:MAG: DUF5074 domain-containing protein [Tannerellaceae bacterium]
MKKNLFLSVCLLLSGLLMSCSNDNNSIPEVEQDTLNRILVLNEGNFAKGNSELYAINAESDQVSENVFCTINGRPLGDVGQSMAIINDKIYAVLNNSAKIEVFDANTYKQVATIPERTNKSISPKTPQINPRYITQLSKDYALVTNNDWIAENENILILINLNNNTIEKIIPTISDTEQLIKVGNTVFIAAGDKILTLDASNPEKQDIINVPVWGTTKIIKDKNNKLWVINSNGLQRINPTDNTVEHTIPMEGINANDWNTFLDIDATGSFLYFNATDINGTSQIYMVSIDAQTMPQEELFSTKNEVKTLYNISISADNHIYICDALDYSQRGLLHKFNQKGDLVKSYTVGIIPQYVLFVNNK